MLIPIITEKSLKDAKAGRYTFRFPKNTTKYEVKAIVEKTFGVHVTSVKTMSQKGGTKTTMMRKKKTVKPSKKAIVTLKDKEKIDLFEAKK
ncbi:MAG: 50S ribosomal protein L23 [Microgenomates group bacterium GW2011_GWC1_37_12b]|uniref:50S ribosomal protein L23 n=1 Tax=Candidatus Woesebacteria bacterium GW2011_GWB1_38_8b TaxID=1618571 RepID=A0A0G0LIH0_9BACT|nr:MAG: 50S ribosomal protein L23 [Microgenomates group bacterium GW2011_GWC1_37_12b]KKQ87715.1 MAG: 50S ribosomal protein L23 [Candidatus Woesebacteria bacterium GW2011_GWB1_38_8b]